MQELHDDIYANGKFIIEVIRDGKNGPEVIRRVEAPNLIVNTGKKQLWRLANGVSVYAFDQMRIGTSPAAAVSADTNVKSPVAGTLKTVDSFSLLAGTRTAQWMKSYPSGGGSISATGIREVCILNQHTSPGGSALNRSIFATVTKTTADKLKITYQARVT